MNIKNNMKKVNFSLKNYNRRTPKVIKLFGDSLLAATTTITTGTLFSALNSITDPTQLSFLLKVSIISSIVGGAGKFLSKFFGEITKLDDTEIEQPNN